MRQRTLLYIGLGLLVASGLVGGLGAALARGAGASSAQTITIAQAQENAQAFVDRTGFSDLVLDEVLQFRQNFYVRVKEKDTGIGAFELLVNPANGAVGYEPGPDMMWNAKYGMMGRGAMMGRAYSARPMRVDAAEATTIAQSWLDQRGAGYSPGSPDTFYGYYTFDFKKDGRVDGMLSVNGSTGQVWFHSWHGDFVRLKEVSSA